MNTDEIHSCHPWCERPICVAVREAVAAEREACAKVCDEFVKQWDAVSTEGYYGNMADGADQCAEAIRARGEQK